MRWKTKSEKVWARYCKYKLHPNFVRRFLWKPLVLPNHNGEYEYRWMEFAWIEQELRYHFHYGKKTKNNIISCCWTDKKWCPGPPLEE
jgi:hypothetical protein